MILSADLCELGLVVVGDIFKNSLNILRIFLAHKSFTFFEMASFLGVLKTIIQNLFAISLQFNNFS